ncbi:hypothetical protein [Persicobacter diffluens]|uniref:Uncharacterized protein n=1 Tax=Persicobacter diffluens TaxID=981 RepID=A0AAN4W3Z2_9BACT|nr:hypothetical protein PEDI_48130 [Persicobacter diffluens]
MKNLILIIVFFLALNTSFAQHASREAKIQYFVEQSVQEFKLDKKQAKKLKEARVEYIAVLSEAQQKFKNGSISKDQQLEINKNASKDFKSFMGQLTGYTPGELDEALAKIRAGLTMI